MKIRVITLTDSKFFGMTLTGLVSFLRWPAPEGAEVEVAVYDFGMEQKQSDHLEAAGFEVVVPPDDPPWRTICPMNLSQYQRKLDLWQFKTWAIQDSAAALAPDDVVIWVDGDMLFLTPRRIRQRQQWAGLEAQPEHAGPCLAIVEALNGGPESADYAGSCAAPDPYLFRDATLYTTDGNRDQDAFWKRNFPLALPDFITEQRTLNIGLMGFRAKAVAELYPMWARINGEWASNPEFRKTFSPLCLDQLAFSLVVNDTRNLWGCALLDRTYNTTRIWWAADPCAIPNICGIHLTGPIKPHDPGWHTHPMCDLYREAVNDFIQVEQPAEARA